MKIKNRTSRGQIQKLQRRTVECMPDLIEEHRDTLETVANADCSASWIAQDLLSSVEGETSYTTEQSDRTDTDVTTQPENSSQKDSLFAY